MKFFLLTITVFSFSTLALADSSFCSSTAAKKLAYHYPETYYGEEKTTIAIEKLKKSLMDECKSLEKAGTRVETIITKVHELCFKAPYDMIGVGALKEENVFSFRMSCQAGRDVAKAYLEGFKAAEKAKDTTCTNKDAISDLSRKAKEIETKTFNPYDVPGAHFPGGIPGTIER